MGPENHWIKLLGLHWGQFPEEWEIRTGRRPEAHSVKLSGDERYVKGLSGMTLALPARAIAEALEIPKFKADREKRLRDAAFSPPRFSTPVAELALPTTDENPRHKEDFTRLVGAVTKKRPPADQT